MANRKKWEYVSHVNILIAQANLDRAKQGLPPLTQEALENGTGLSRQAIYRWRSTKPLSSVSAAAKEGFMRFFGVTEEQLYTKREVNASPESMPGAARLTA